MKPVSQIVLTVIVAVVSAIGASSLIAPRSAPAAQDDAATARLATTLAEVQADQRALRTSLDSLALRMSAATPSHGAVPLQEIETAVGHALDEREASAKAAALLADKDAVPAPADGALDAESAAAALLDPALDRTAREELWLKVRKAGLLDQVLAIYEARAKANPNDPALQVDLGHAYLQKIFEVGSGPLAGVWATKADKAFDAALVLDDHNWDARFSKAVSLSFWPPIFGKQAEAIGNFETLIKQQQGQASNPKFAQTYLLLGNLYQQQGKNDLAQAAWKNGLSQYPTDEDLLAKVGGGK